jgi:hypothetical protein
LLGSRFPVMQIIPEVLDLRGKPASLKVGSIGTSSVTLRSTPGSVEPSKLLDSIGRGGLGAQVSPLASCWCRGCGIMCQLIRCIYTYFGSSLCQKVLWLFHQLWRLMILDLARLLGAFWKIEQSTTKVRRWVLDHEEQSQEEWCHKEGLCGCLMDILFWGVAESAWVTCCVRVEVFISVALWSLMLGRVSVIMLFGCWLWVDGCVVYGGLAVAVVFRLVFS